jgi:hypothetical protein
MSKFGLRLPESVGFGILGATIGAVVCDLLGAGAENHTGIGMALGAFVVIALGHLPLQRAALILQRMRAARESPARLAPR